MGKAFPVHQPVWECGKDFQVPPEPERPTANAGAEETTASQSELKATVREGALDYLSTSGLVDMGSS